MPVSPRLDGRFALVTGGSRGIGRAVVERFAAEGATVAINYHGHEEEAEEARAAASEASRAGGHGEREHIVLQGDVSSAAAAQAMVDAAVAAFGRLDILVNNAGIQFETPSEQVSPEDLNKVLGVNLLGAAYASQAAIRHFLTRPGGGAIVNNSSVHELIPKPGYLSYSMSKHGMRGLTRTLALEFADRGIRVNTVGPGATLTDINNAWRNDPEKRGSVERHIPMGRAAQAEEVARAFAFLASDEAAYITGQTLFVDGGLTLYGEFRENWAS
jgi:glucose 1-dehydrogenase